MSTVNRTHTQARDAQVIAGIQKHLQTASSLPLVGSTYTPADLVKLVQSRIDSANGSATVKASWHSSVVEDRTLNTKVTPVIRALRQHVINVFGATSPVLADFGFTPPKRATRTPEQKAASAAKAKATRAARHTMGKVQKKGRQGCRHRHHRDAHPCAAAHRNGAEQPDDPCDEHGSDGCRAAAGHHELSKLVATIRERGAPRCASGRGGSPLPPELASLQHDFDNDSDDYNAYACSFGTS